MPHRHPYAVDGRGGPFELPGAALRAGCLTAAAVPDVVASSVEAYAIAAGAGCLHVNAPPERAAYAALLTTTGTVNTSVLVARRILQSEPDYLKHLLGRLTKDLAVDALDEGLSIVTKPTVEYFSVEQYLGADEPKVTSKACATWQEIPDSLWGVIKVQVSAKTRLLLDPATATTSRIRPWIIT